MKEAGMSANDDANQTACSDPSIPNMARMWDYFLGGTDNFATDRDAARIVLRAAPDFPLAALENREFLKHVVRFLTQDANIMQFIDIGSGLPTQGNVHQIAEHYIPDARVVYVDNDSFVLEQGRAYVSNIPGVTFIEGDLRRPDAMLENPELQQVIDFSKPVALCVTLVLHFIAEEEDPHKIVARLRAKLAPDSYIVISHAAEDDHNEDIIRQATGAYDRASAPLVMRSQEEIRRFFAGLELVDPGVVFLSQWRPMTGCYVGGGTRWAYAGVGRKPCPRSDAGVVS
jgi:SAM-dependent methyltransferase